MRAGTLFSGIGGLDLGLERAGFSIGWQAENEPYCARVLAKHWRGIPNYGDVTKVEWEHAERVDLIAGGFPCQPVSNAGQQRAQADERWLWPEYARCVRDVRPGYVLVENVPGLLVRGMGDVLGDLASLGYDARWGSVRASDVGAPHRRERVFIVARLADADEPGLAGRLGGAPPTATTVGVERRGASSGAQGVADAEGEPERPGLRTGVPGGQRRRRPGDRGGPRDPWTIEPDVGRVADGVPARVDRLRGLGNAVVPQVAQWLGERILAGDL